jgi:hypothetical protein
VLQSTGQTELEIGNPNAGKAASTQEKINATTPKTGLSSNPTGKGQK